MLRHVGKYLDNYVIKNQVFHKNSSYSKSSINTGFFFSVKREKEEETLEKENSELRRRIYANKIEARQIESDCEQLDKDIMQLQEEVSQY